MKDITDLGGKTMAPVDIQRIEAATALTLPRSVSSLLTTLPLVGLTFVLDERRDTSGLGADFRWMTPEEMIDEATEAYPGIVAVQMGFLPIGICLEGSGDPYFTRLADGAVVRIPHDAVRHDSLETDRVEHVAPSIHDLIELSEITGPS